MSPRIRRLFLASAGAFAGFTFAWILVGLFNRGDAFPQGPAVTMLPLLLVGPVLGVLAGRRASSQLAVVTILAFSVLAAVFWARAPAGWWASGPPPMPGAK
ncbi:hypothetical protein [Nannocystis punicea]|uniref:Uncharacterized protein n=1 Tax=Nannocystis punicea TaxID=2995304 RepID=A0ABY7GX02_9BACT|nr:hypothetical protein [Nannocystis poenicansa]WAS91399.1 hypothetical protein O0S08_34870 [Nannocystis poenicansa]